MKHFVDQKSLDIEISHGEGCYLFDTNGKRYLDMIAGWCVGSIGWGHPEVRKALEKEAKRGTYIPIFLQTKEWEELATMLIKHAPGKRLQKVFPCTSGSEAVDMAIKCVRAATKKDKILSIKDVYHGHTYGAASVGDAGQRIKGPLVPGFKHLPMPGRDDSAEKVLSEIERNLAKRDVVAFLSEPLWTNAGVYVPPADFFPAVQKLCRKYGALFVMDEVATGFGHAGTLFASELWGLEPDVLTIGKAFTGGYATMAATLTSADVYEKSKGIPCYSTFAWLPTDLAATHANVSVILREKLWLNAKSVGAYFLTLLKPLESLSVVAEVRGKGLLIGIELKGEKTCEKMQKRLAQEGLILEIAGNALFMAPHLILTKAQAKEAADILNGVLRSASKM